MEYDVNLKRRLIDASSRSGEMRTVSVTMLLIHRVHNLLVTLAEER